MLATTLALDVNVGISTHDAATGALLAYEERHNLVVDAGLNLIRDLLLNKNTAGNSLGYFAIGTGAAAAAAGQTALVTETYRDTITSTTANAKQLIVTYSLDASHGNGATLTEAGLFNASSAGTMFARAVHTGIAKSASVVVTYTWTINLAAT